MRTYMHACIHTYTHMNVYFYLFAHIQMYIHIYIYIYIHIYTYSSSRKEGPLAKLWGLRVVEDGSLFEGLFSGGSVGDLGG